MVGFFGALEERFTGDFGVATRREWAVLPRNSAGFWVVRGRGAAIQCTADSTGVVGRKNF